MDDNYKISVIIPVFNTKEYLSRCLDSVLNNTYRNIEVICINDGSTDESLMILRKYAELDNRVIVIDKGNEGVSATRNVGLSRATGYFIAFVDSDDWVHPQYFELMITAYNKTKADIIAVNYICTTAPQQTVYIHTDECVYTNLDFQNTLKNGYLKRIVWGRIYLRSFIAEHHFPVGIKWGEDAIFNVDLLSDFKKSSITLIDCIGYYYFQRETSACNTVKINEKMSVCKHYLHIGSCEADPIRKAILISECAKQLCVCRYEAGVFKNLDEYAQCERLIKKCRKELVKASVSIRQKLVYIIFFLFPWLYRLFRIIDDPSLLSWEDSIKKE